MAYEVNSVVVEVDADVAPLERSLTEAEQKIQATSLEMKSYFSQIGESITDDIGGALYDASYEFNQMFSDLKSLDIDDPVEDWDSIAEVIDDFSELHTELASSFKGYHDLKNALSEYIQLAKSSEVDIVDKDTLSGLEKLKEQINKTLNTVSTFSNEIRTRTSGLDFTSELHKEFDRIEEEAQVVFPSVTNEMKGVTVGGDVVSKSLKGINEEFKKIVKPAEDTNKQLKSVGVNSKQFTDLKKVIKDLKTEFTALSGDLKRNSTDMGKIDSVLHNTDKAIEGLRGTVYDLEHQYKSATDEINKLSKDLATSDTDIQKLTTSLSKTETNLAKTTLGLVDMKNTVKTLSSDLSSATSSISKLERENAKILSKFEALEQTVSKYKTELDSCKSSIKDYQGEINKLNKEIESNISEFVKVDNQLISQTQATKKAEQALKDYKDGVSKNNQALRGFADDIKVIDLYMSDLDTATKESASGFNKFQSELSKSDSELAKVKSDLDNVNKSLGGMGAEQQGAFAYLTRVGVDVTGLVSNLDQLRIKQTQLGASASTFQQDLIKESKSLKDLRTELSIAEANLKTMSKSNTTSTKEVKDAEAKVKALTTAYKAKEQTVNALTSRLTNLTTQQRTLSAQITTASNSVKNASTSLGDYNTALSNNKKKLKELEDSLFSHNKGLKNTTTSINGLKTAIGSLLAMMGGRELYTWLIGNEAEYNRSEKQLGLLINNVQKASEMMNDLRELSINSPYNLPDLQLMTKQLAGTALQIEQIEDMIPRIATLGQGDAAKMASISKVIQDVVTAGKLQGEELRQLKNTGIDATSEIVRILGISQSQLKKLQMEGKITSDIFLQAIKNITDEGGKYYGLLDAMAEDYLGQVAQLKGHIIEIGKTLGREMGTELNDVITDINNKLKDMASSGALDKKIQGFAEDLKEIFLVVKDLAGLLANVGNFLLNNKELVYSIAKGFLAWKISSAFVGGLIGISTKFSALNKTIKDFNKWLTLKNIVKVDFTSITGLKTAIASVVTVTKDANGVMTGLALTTKGVALSTQLLTGGVIAIASAVTMYAGYTLGKVMGQDLADANKAIVETKNLISQTTGTLVNLFATYNELKDKNQETILEVAVGLDTDSMESSRSDLMAYFVDIEDIQNNRIGELTDYQRDTVKKYVKELEEIYGVTGFQIDETTGKITNMYDVINASNLDLAVLHQFGAKLDEVDESVTRQLKGWTELSGVLSNFKGYKNISGDILDIFLLDSGIYMEQDIEYLHELINATDDLTWSYESLVELADKNVQSTKSQSDANEELKRKYRELETAGRNAGVTIANEFDTLKTKTEESIYYVDSLIAKLNELDGIKISIDSEIDVDDLSLDAIETFLSSDLMLPDGFLVSLDEAVVGLQNINGAAEDVINNDLQGFYDQIIFKQMQLDELFSTGQISLAGYQEGYSLLNQYMVDGTRTISELAPQMAQKILEMLNTNETNMQTSYTSNVTEWSALLQEFAYYAIEVGLITEAQANSIISNIKTATGELKKELAETTIDLGKEKYDKIYNPPTTTKKTTTTKEKTPEQKASEELALIDRKYKAEMIKVDKYETQALAVRNKYFKKGTLEYIEYTKKIEEVVKKHQEDLLKIEKESLDDRLELTEKYFAEQQFKAYANDNFISAYKRVQARYVEALKKGIIEQKDYNSAMEKLGDEAYASKLAHSERWIDVQLRQNNLTLQQEMDAWGRIAKYTEDAYNEGLIDYVEYKEKMQDINDNYYDISYKYLEKQLDKFMDAEKKSYDKRKQEIIDYYDAIDKAETKEEREKELSELLSLEEKFAHATTAQGKKRLEELREQIASIRKEEEREEREAQRDSELAELDDEYSAFETHMANLQEDLGKFATTLSTEFSKTGATIETTFTSVLDNINNSFLTLGNNLSPIGSQLADLVADLNTFNSDIKSTAMGSVGGVLNNQTVQVVNNTTNNVAVKSNTDARAFGSSISNQLGAKIAQKGGF